MNVWARGLALFGISLYGFLALTWLLVSVTLVPLGVGFLLVPDAVGKLRHAATLARRYTTRWSGVEIAAEYPPTPAFERGFLGSVEHIQWLLQQPMTRRDMAWAAASPFTGGLLALLPLALAGYGVEGVLMPLIWAVFHPYGFHDWYAGIPVNGVPTSLVCVPAGAAVLTLGVWSRERLMFRAARLEASLLSPPLDALQRRVEQLTESRAEAVDSSAAELRRIERDLHDGAQARLVAMGMTLGAIEHLLDRDPEKARQLLSETRIASSKALSELRDLVRGIHPPVLSDRGLVDAVKALALDCPLDVEVTAELPARPDAPVESAVYFAVSEILTNAAKHSGADRGWIDLRHEAGSLRVSITDDGHGGACLDKGSGLRGIERRIGTFDGVLAVTSPVGGPTTVTLELPCALSSRRTSSF